MRWRSGNASVCKTDMRGFDSRPHLQMEKHTSNIIDIDKVFIKNYIVIAKHGYYKEEYYKPQRFVVSVTCDIKSNSSGKSDDLEETFNYENIRNVIDQVLKSEHHKLVEFLAEEISNKVLGFNIVNRVEVEITKPDIWGDCSPGVLISRARI